MATEILAVGSTVGQASADIEVGAGEVVTLGIKSPNDYLFVEIAVQVKDDAGAYWTIGNMGPGNPGAVISSPGTYRCVRSLGTCGVFRA